MVYNGYQLATDALQPLRAIVNMAHTPLTPVPGIPGLAQLSFMAEAWGLLSRAGITHHRPDFRIDQVPIGDQQVTVTEEIADWAPFATLLHFRKAVTTAYPRVLVVAPMAGHFSTLLRNTVRTLLPDYDVYLTDWHNARDIPTSAGAFGFDDYVEYVIRFIEKIGPGGHVLAVCQPCVHVLTAIAAMAEEGNPAQPRSMTLLAGPVDTRVNPTSVNRFASSKSIDWFEQNLITVVPWYLKGAGRRIYPGLIQLMAFMSMEPHRHGQAGCDFFAHMVNGELGKADAITEFYNEYFAVSDLPAEFYLETVQRVFQQALLARHELVFRGRPVNPGVIQRTALLTVEGERDNICAVGQTAAAHDLCTGLGSHLKQRHIQPGVGHYGVFSGQRWQQDIYPIVRKFILSANRSSSKLRSSRIGVTNFKDCSARKMARRRSFAATGYR